LISSSLFIFTELFRISLVSRKEFFFITLSMIQFKTRKYTSFHCKLSISLTCLLLKYIMFSSIIAFMPSPLFSGIDIRIHIIKASLAKRDCNVNSNSHTVRMRTRGIHAAMQLRSAGACVLASRKIAFNVSAAPSEFGRN